MESKAFAIQTKNKGEKQWGFTCKPSARICLVLELDFRGCLGFSVTLGNFLSDTNKGLIDYTVHSIYSARSMS